MHYRFHRAAWTFVMVHELAFLSVGKKSRVIISQLRQEVRFVPREGAVQVKSSFVR